MAFITHYGINISGHQKVWWVEGKEVVHLIIRVDESMATISICFGIQELDDHQQSRLQDTLGKWGGLLPADLMKPVQIAEHVILAPDEKAVKQRIARRSPAVMDALLEEVDRLMS